MKMPEFSFVVLCYNFERYIGECLRSILAQEGDVDFEVVVVDDASTDSSVGRIREFIDERITFVPHERNVGHAGSINEALRLARAPLIARIDGDDRYRPGFLTEMIEIFSKHPEVGLAYADSARIDENGRVEVDGQDLVHGGKDFLGSEFHALLGKNFICAPTIVARREAWLSIPPVPSHLAFHDWYFTLLMSRDWQFFYRSRVLAEYRIHGANMHSAVARAGTEERSVLWLLNSVFADERTDPARMRTTARQRRLAYAAFFKEFADKYFYFERDRDAARCYFEYVRRRPSGLFDLGVLRRLVGTAIGRRRYEAVKNQLRRR